MGWNEVSPVHLVLLPILWLSVLLYLFIVFKILLARRAHSSLFLSPFFTLVLGQSVWDLSMFFISFFLVFCRRYLLFPFVPIHDGLFPKAVYFLQTFFPNCLYFNSVLYAISRFSAFKWPTKHQHIWITRNIVLCEIFVAIVSAINVGRLFLGDHYVSLLIIVPGRMKMDQDSDLLVQDSYQDLILSIGCCLTCAVLYSWSAWRSARLGIKNLKYQKRFLRCAITVFLPYIPNAVKSFLLIYAGNTNNNILISYCIESWLFVIYLMCLLQPWVLLYQYPRIRPVFRKDEGSEQSNTGQRRFIEARRQNHDTIITVSPVV